MPKYAEFTLTPLPGSSPTPRAIKLLKQVCSSALNSDSSYTVTVPAPAISPLGPNHLLVLRPYFWQVAPGQWERRDGERNPYCESPGQKQLQQMSMVTHALAMGVAHLPDLRAQCITRLEHLLDVFFLDPHTRMHPQVKYAQCQPGIDPLVGDKTFVIAARYLILVSQAMRMSQLTGEVAVGMRRWLSDQVEWMESSPQGISARQSGNNITVWYHAMLASHLAYVDRAKATAYASDAMEQLVTHHPTPAAFFAPELERTKPRHYTLFSLEALFILAEATSSSSSSLSSSSSSSSSSRGDRAGAYPPNSVTTWLESLVEYARTVKQGEMEGNENDDAQYPVQIAWYSRILDRWNGRAVSDTDPDGSPWEAGWNQRSRLAWAMV